MSGSGCCFLTCIQISQEADKVVWYSHLLENFPQFLVMNTVKSFSVVNEAEVDFFLKFSCFFYDPKWMCGVGREEKIYILCGKAERRGNDRLFRRVCREASLKKGLGGDLVSAESIPGRRNRKS